MNRKEIDFERTVRKLKDVLSGQDEVVFAYLHGSFVQGEEFRDVDVAEVLRELGLLEAGFVERLKRNLYWKLDDKKIHQILKQDIQDIKEYLRAIAQVII